MGLPPSGQMANLYLFTYELAFVRRLVESGDVQTAAHFQFHARYIDDVLSWNNRLFDRLRYVDGQDRQGNDARLPAGIYPREVLNLGLEGETDFTEGDGDLGYLPYLDCCVRWGRSRRPTVNRTYIDIFYKSNSPGYAAIPFTRYPRMDSAFSESAAYSMVMSECTRMSVCTRRVDFEENVASLVYALVSWRGYDEARLLRVIARFVGGKSNSEMYASKGCLVDRIRTCVRLYREGRRAPRFTLGR